MYYSSNGELVRDNGAVYENYTERELTNQITLKVKTILEENGINVDLTRDFNESVTLPNTKIEIYNDKDELIYTGTTNEEGKIK